MGVSIFSAKSFCDNFLIVLKAQILFPMSDIQTSPLSFIIVDLFMRLQPKENKKPDFERNVLNIFKGLWRGVSISV